MPRRLRQQRTWRCESCQHRDASRVIRIRRRAFCVCDACADWGLRPALAGAR